MSSSSCDSETGGVIDALVGELTELATVNTHLRAACEHLEQQLFAVTTACDRNISLLECMNAELERENAELQSEVESRQALLDQINALYAVLHARGDCPPDLAVLGRSPSHDGGSLVAESTGTMDPIAERIVRRCPYFAGCRTNQDFVVQVRRLSIEVQSRTSDASWEAGKLRGRIEGMERRQAVEMNGRAEELAALRAQQEELDRLVRLRRKE
jgi:hypothetical protein